MTAAWPGNALSSTTLSERASKELLAAFGVPFVAERAASDVDDAIAAATALGYPVAVKLNGDGIAHKTERRLVRLGLADADAVAAAAADLLAAARPEDGTVDLLVAPMVTGLRELIAGAVRDPLFGPSVMLGVGGVLAEAVADVVFRPAPLDRVTAEEMIDDLRTQALLGAFRGEEAVDRQHLAETLIALGRVLCERDDVAGVDVNPLIVAADGKPVAVDALVEVGPSPRPRVTTPRRPPTPEQFAALFEPRGVLVAGASTHPGKFGFVALHNVLASGYAGAVWATNLHGDEVLGVRTVADVAAIPDGEVDLVFVCTPPEANVPLLRACAGKGISAAFVTSAGYAEAGEDGSQGTAGARRRGRRGRHPPRRAQRAGRRQHAGVAVRPDRRPVPTARAHRRGQPERQLRVQLPQPRHLLPVSGSRGRCRPATPLRSPWPTTSRSSPRTRRPASASPTSKAYPTVAACSTNSPTPPAASRSSSLKGGRTAAGARAAASHTGALAADDTVFEGECRAAGITRARSVEEAFEAAATFATQPAPCGNRVAVVTTAGGWGVVTADAISAEERPRTSRPARRPAPGDRPPPAPSLEPEQPY